MVRRRRGDASPSCARLNERERTAVQARHAIPGVTTVGRFLGRSSIDELPQLFNVLNGTMSLVGPRPALPSEDAAVRRRAAGRASRCRPGSPASGRSRRRDNPSFSAYRRLDLFYIENWSIGLDITILLRTIPLVAARALRSSPDEGAGETARTDTALADSLLVEVIE